MICIGIIVAACGKWHAIAIAGRQYGMLFSSGLPVCASGLAGESVSLCPLGATWYRRGHHLVYDCI